MADVSSHFASVREVLIWAEESINEFNEECRSFFDDNPFSILTEFDAEARQNVVKIKLGKSLPTSISRRATEALSHTVTNEVILARVPLGLQIHNNAAIAFDIAFNEAPPLRDLIVDEALRHFLEKARSVSQGLEEEAIKITSRGLV